VNAILLGYPTSAQMTKVAVKFKVNDLISYAFLREPLFPTNFFQPVITGHFSPWTFFAQLMKHSGAAFPRGPFRSADEAASEGTSR
jgi:hypothetical protein